MNEQAGYDTLKNIKKLSIAERILIVEDIWDSIITSKEEIPVSDEQKEKLDSRIEAYYKNPNEVKTWSEVRNSIQSQL
ncbi:MAG: addiction module protein [Bacteroidetes bacterium]|nr:addiction module protein [Bacteroidota bacterium]MBU1679479.1 addiction module protein [Bacteroidota bacterium]